MELVVAIIGSGALTALITGIFGLSAQQKQSTKTIIDKLDAVDEKVEKNRDDVDNLRFEWVRREILDFAARLMNGGASSLEQFAGAMKTIEIYEKQYAEKHNGELKESIKFIDAEYAAFLKYTKEKNKKRKDETS